MSSHASDAFSLSPACLPADPAHLTRALQEVLDQRASIGGGRVSLEAGEYHCGSLNLPTNVELHLCHAARLVACDDPALFPPLGRHDGALTANHGFGALIQARDAHNIAVSGSGTLDGGGAWDQVPDWSTAQGMFRPAVCYFENCRDLSMDSLHIVGAKWWTLHLLRCQDIRLTGLRMRNNWPNSDGIDPDGCRNLVISDCHLVCGDDCIVAKSTQGDTCENLTVTNCILETSCVCLKLGTESRGAFRNVLFSNCVCRGDVAFGLFLKDGGCMENVLASQILFDCNSAYPIIIDAMRRDYRSGKAGRIRNVRVSNCLGRGAGRVWIEGSAEEPLENISLTEIDWNVTGPLPQPPVRKPLGSARVILDPARPAFEVHPAQVLAMHVNDLTVKGLSLCGEGAAEREVLWTHEVRGLKC